jgi:Putative metal-binding motif
MSRKSGEGPGYGDGDAGGIMWWMMTTGALAAGLVEGPSWPLAEAAQALLVVPRSEGDRVVVAGATASEVLDDAGSSLGSLGGAAALANFDLDLDGSDDLVLCGADGVWIAPWPGALPDTAALLASQACSAVVAWDIDGETGLALGLDGTVALWVTAGGAVTEARDPGFSVAEPMVLVSGTDSLAAATVGATRIEVLDRLGVSSLAVGGSVVDVAALDSDWLIALSDLQLLRALDGDDVALGAAPRAILVSDLDGDGNTDLVALVEGGVEVWYGDGGWAWAEAPVGASLLAAVDTDLDHCADLLLDDPDAAGLQVLLTDGCVAPVDDDGDGWSVADGDCNDLDAAVHPGASEICNGVDDDCDAAVDEVEVGIDVSSPVDEGGSTLFWAFLEGCDPGLNLTLDDPSVDGVLSCTISGVEATCSAWDDGEVTIRAAATVPVDDEGTGDAGDTGSMDTGTEDTGAGDSGDSGVGDTGAEVEEEAEVVAVAVATLEVVNVDPSFSIPAPFEGDLRMELGQSYSAEFIGSDPGRDTVTFSADSAPSWFRLSPSGSVQVDADEMGEWEIRVVASDGDGGTASATVVVVVEAGDTGSSTTYQSGCSSDPADDMDCSGGSCCAFVVPVFGLVGALRRRRRDPEEGARQGAD